MDPRQRFLAALQGRPVDRTPVAHVAALTTVELQQMTGCPMPEVHLDPARQARLLFANHEVLGLDAVTFLINYFSEPWALGVEIDWGDPSTLPVFTSHPWRCLDDAVVPTDLLDRRPIRTCLETLRVAKRDYGATVAVLGKVMGPFSMAQVMHGVENLMMATIDDRGMVMGLLDVCADVLVKVANAQLETGIDALAIGEGGAGANMLSPAMYEELLLPVHQSMLGRIHGPTIMHICGDVTARLPMFQHTGMDCFNFDWAISPQNMVDTVGEAVRLMGNINTTDLLRGSPSQIKQQVVECLDAGVDIVSPGCAISPNCPNANLRAMADAVAEYAQP
jgi:[methyl-Co(III) methanol-specific corrinoid protein]:coenzyme M methyltransferase